MVNAIEIRDTRADDLSGIEALYPITFPDEDLLPLVRELMDGRSLVLSLAGLVGETVVAHGIFSPCGIAGTTRAVALLGPLAVTPDWQGRGIGGKIIRHGLQRLKGDGVDRVFVLGDPAYYGRFGFQPDYLVAPPYSLPEEWRVAWQSVSLIDDVPNSRGTLSVPRPWMQPALWEA